FMNGATAGEIFMVVESGGQGNWRMADFGTSTFGSVYPWSNGYIYDDFGSNNQYLLGNFPQDIYHFHLYNISSQLNSWVARLDGVEEFRSSLNTVAFNVNPQLGHCRTEYFLGNIAELIVYDRALPPAERKTVENYLGQKYAFLALPSVPTTL